MENNSQCKQHSKKRAASQLAAVRVGVWRRIILFLFSKALMIALTIFVGVFATVLLASKSGQLEKIFRAQATNEVFMLRRSLPTPLSPKDETRLAVALTEAETKFGVNLPFWPRQVKWTLEALRMDWGWPVDSRTMVFSPTGKTNLTYREIILQYFPSTVLLAGASSLLIFLFGIPLALYLARNYDHWLDRLLSLLVPISSVPSWVHGVLLISIFAVELRWLPPSGMLDAIPPNSTWEYLTVVLQHLVLPVLAICLSLFFQLVYAWRTYFLIYSEEDYVELARAKGLPNPLLERQYILKPALSYVITSFALTLVTFWQAIMALEVVFNWPGIGWLFIKKGLPNFWGESMYKGNMMIAVGIVVIFAYLLGAVVFILDVMYVVVDPRIHLSDRTTTGRLKAKRTWAALRFWRTQPRAVQQPRGVIPKPKFGERVVEWVGWAVMLVHSLRDGLKSVAVELRRYPQAMIGLSIIALLVIGSLYAVLALPYEKIGRSWASERLTGRAEIPSLAQPAWVNWFRREKLLSTLNVSIDDGNIPARETTLENGLRMASYDLSFNYPYAEPPREVFLYLQSNYLEKRPFVSLTWVTPDGRPFDLRGVSVDKPLTYDFDESISYKRLVAANPHLQKWFEMGRVNSTPAHYLLFVDQSADAPETVRGAYHLQMDVMFFEPEGNIRADLVLLGQVYGLAGTDYLRRDLLVPLLWGLPFALLFGLLGALVTTFLSIIVAASGVWFGGWVDNFIQRLTEANMILPVLAMGVLAQALFNISLWVILAVVVLLNIFGSPVKTFRAALLQIKEAPYVEAAQAYNASHWRIIFSYLLPRIVPVLVPQLITLIPSYVFLEATLGLFNIKSDYPTWGMVIYQALTKGAMWGSTYWVLEPLGMLLLTGLAFAMLGYALERILNPRLKEKG